MRFSWLPALLLPSLAQAFVILSGPEEAKLNVSEDSPQITFYLTTEVPPVKEKEKFLDGRYADLEDLAFWEALVTEAMSRWNQVPGAFVEMNYTLIDQAELNSEDNIHTIAISKTSLTSSAFARPRFENGLIYDCDIAISDRESTATSLAYTVLHELGHCLGLGHNHNDPNAVMGYTRNNRKLSLGLDDMAGVAYLYPRRLIGKPEDLVGCGNIGYRDQGGVPWSLVIVLCFPLLFWGIMRLRSSKET